MKRILAVMILLFAVRSQAQLITAAQLNTASNALRNLNIASSNALFAMNQATSNYLFSISGGGGGTNVTLAQLLATSNALRIVMATIGANDTNYANGIFSSLSNSLYTFSSANSNYTLTAAFALSNYVNSRAQALTNLINVRSTSLSNLSYTIGSAGTNYTLATSNSLYTNLLAQISALTNIASGSFIETDAGLGTNNSLYAATLIGEDGPTTVKARDLTALAVFGYDTYQVFLRQPYFQTASTNAAYNGSASGDFLHVNLAASNGSMFSNSVVITSGAYRRSLWERVKTGAVYDFGLDVYSLNAEAMLPLCSYTNADGVLRWWQPLALHDDLLLPAIGASALLRTDGSSNVAAVTVGSGIAFDGITLTATLSASNRFSSVVVTNGEFRLQTNSTLTVQQVDYASGPSAYYVEKLSTDRTFQITNIWTAGVSNRPIDFYIGGSDSATDYNVTFSCPNPGGVVFHYGVNSVTNGSVTVTVTNNHALGASVTPWKSNLVEVYFSHVR